MIWLALMAGTALAAGSPREHGLFDMGWRFHLGEVPGGQQTNCNDSGWRVVELPHDWSAETAFSQTNASCTAYLPGGVGWYRKSFATDPAWAGRKVFATFDGVYRNSEVWINGHSLGKRPFGYITFQYELTPYLVSAGTNVLAVRVERNNVADSRWYPGSGIYRNVWLTVTQPVYVPIWGNVITTPRADARCADVVVHTEVANQTAAAQRVSVTWQILKPDGVLASELSQSKDLAPDANITFSQWQKVAAPDLWSPDSPALYLLVIRVFADGRLVDETRTPFGIRTFYFDANRGFFLNGKNLKLKGVCLHHDGGVVGAAVPEDVLARRLKLLKEIGANAVRASHNPMAPEFYEVCDRIGLLVMDEAFDEWETGKRKWVAGRNVGSANRFGYSSAFPEWSEQDCADMVRRDRNHPSIILWSLGNEIDYPTDPYVLAETRTVEGFAQESNLPQQTRLTVAAPKLIAAVKRNDPTRPVTMALANLVSSDATGLAQMLDVVGYNYQEADYNRDHQEFPTRVIYGSENSRSYEPWQVVTDHPFVAGQFLWTGFDFLGEAGEWPNHGSQSGLFDTRGFLKPSAYQRQALWSDAPLVRLAVSAATEETPRHPWPAGLARWNWPAASKLSVSAFSNCERVELRVNGRVLATRLVGKDRAARFEVAYEAGWLEAVGFRQGQSVATNRLVTAGVAVALRAESDRATLPADGRSVAHVVVSVVDGQGNPVDGWQDTVTVEVTGAGRLLGLDNGDLNDPTSLADSSKKFKDGQALVLLQSGRTPGGLTLRVTTPSLRPAKMTLPVMPWQQ